MGQTGHGRFGGTATTVADTNVHGRIAGFGQRTGVGQMMIAQSNVAIASGSRGGLEQRGFIGRLPDHGFGCW